MNKTSTVISQIKNLICSDPDILLCILFGSVAEQREHFTSDLDIAMAGTLPIGVAKKQELIEKFALTFGRPVDLIDLQTITGTLLHQILTKGKLIYCDDHILYANIIKKMLFNQSDMMPYHYRILKERREQWINE